MEVTLLVCAESSSLDQATNNLSILNVVEGLNAPIFPVALPLTVVAILRRKKNESATQTLRLRILLDGQQQPLFDAPLPIDFQGKLKSRAIGRIQTLVIPEPGSMRVTILRKKEILGEWQIDVNQAAQPEVFEPLVRRTITVDGHRKASSSTKRQSRKRK